MKQFNLLVLCVLTISMSAQITPIYDIQGNGAASPFDGQNVTTEGIVVGDFQDGDQLDGFFLQDQNGDADASTSDGILIYDPNGMDVAIGDHVTVMGTVQEFFGMTEIASVTSVVINSSGNILVPTDVSLPYASAVAPEAFEGMLITFPQTLVLTDQFNVGRFGEFTLAFNDILPSPTNVVDPNDDPASGTTTSGNSNVANVNAQMDANALAIQVVDDGSSVQNPDPIPWINPADSTIRGGTTVSAITGCLNYSFGFYKLTPTMVPAFNYETRPSVPTFPGANVTVACFNVLNYWTTIDDGNNGARGADSPAEFVRQQAKLVATISAMNADVLGLMELESNGSVAVDALVAALNAEMGAGTYVVNPDPSTTGIDVIKTVIIYKPAVVTPVGSPITSDDVIYERPPVAQTFSVNANAGIFNFIAVHYRFKGCTGAVGLDEDQFDGQGCFNETRRLESFELLNIIDSIQLLSNDDDVLIAGDYNAYKQEDPMDILRADGLTDLIPTGHTSLFMAEWGALDHAFATSGMNAQVMGAQIWNCNSDEPHVIDYNDEFINQDLYAVNAYRSSDHDPLVIGLNVIGSIGIGSTHRNEDFQMFPIPANDQLNFQFKSPGSSIKIFDMRGKLIRDNNIGNVLEFIMDVSSLIPGSYVVLVEFKDGKSIYRQFIIRP